MLENREEPKISAVSPALRVCLEHTKSAGRMLPRRGYEPVDDEDAAPSPSPREPTGRRNSTLRSSYASIQAAESASLNENDPSSSSGVAASDCANASNTRTAALSGTVLGTDEEENKDVNGMTVRILDVQGQTYPLSVSPGTTVRELKTMLVEAAGVEIARQRIIHGGKVLIDVHKLSVCV